MVRDIIFVVEFEIRKSGESCSELHHLVNAVRPPSVIDSRFHSPVPFKTLDEILEIFPPSCRHNLHKCAPLGFSVCLSLNEEHERNNTGDYNARNKTKMGRSVK